MNLLATVRGKKQWEVEECTGEVLTYYTPEVKSAYMGIGFKFSSGITSTTLCVQTDRCGLFS